MDFCHRLTPMVNHIPSSGQGILSLLFGDVKNPVLALPLGGAGGGFSHRLTPMVNHIPSSGRGGYSHLKMLRTRSCHSPSGRAGGASATGLRLWLITFHPPDSEVFHSSSKMLRTRSCHSPSGRAGEGFNLGGVGGGLVM